MPRHGVGQRTWVSGLHRVPVCSAPPQRGQKRALQPAPGHATCFTPTCMGMGYDLAQTSYVDYAQWLHAWCMRCSALCCLLLRCMQGVVVVTAAGSWSIRRTKQGEMRTTTQRRRSPQPVMRRARTVVATALRISLTGMLPLCPHAVHLWQAHIKPWVTTQPYAQGLLLHLVTGFGMQLQQVSRDMCCCQSKNKNKE